MGLVGLMRHFAMRKIREVRFLLLVDIRPDCRDIIYDSIIHSRMRLLGGKKEK